MHRGYIKLWRKIQDNKFWNERRKFSKSEAWIDLLMEARHNSEPCEVMFGMTSVECHQGQCVKSTRTWAARWGWSEHKVRDFLKLLRDSRAISTKTGAKWTQITILNYSQYQDDGRKLDARRSHDGRTTGDKQECKECKNEKKENYVLLSGDNGKDVASPTTPPPVIPYSKIISLLNSTCGSRYKVTDTYKRHIKARWNAGYREDDFARVIEMKFREWGTDEKMVKFLRPETLFGTKMPSYLGCVEGGTRRRPTDTGKY